MLKVIDVLNFIRNADKLKDWSDYQIIKMIKDAIDAKAFVFTTDQKGDLSGIVIGAFEELDRLRIKYILCKNTKIFHGFVKYFLKHYGDFDIVAQRKGRAIQYNTKKLCSKILSLT